MAEWYLHPLKIDEWNEEIDCVMFIDENGSSGRIQDIYNKIANNQEIDNDNKYFTITGCIFENSEYIKSSNNICNFKEKYWNKGYYFYTKTNDYKYVCLHSREIRRHDGAFNDSLINHQKFIEDLSKVLVDINCIIVSVTINLENYIRKGNVKNVYEIGFDLLLERYIYATKNNRKGIIILESRGKKEDKLLLGHISKIIRKKGTKGIRKNELMKKIKGVFFNPKWYDNHSSTFAGLEIVDLFSYPIHQYVKYNKSNLAFDTLKSKINGYPNFKNKGVKIYP